MKGRILLGLFALPFAAVGAFMAWSVGNTLISASEMQDWVPVEARLTSGGYKTHSGDDSDTYEAYATYTWNRNGQTYSGSRVGIDSGADNIGDYQQDWGWELSDAYNSGRPITIYVNPDDPSDAVIDRSIRWGLVGFKMIFVITFGGVGFGLLIFTLLGPKEKDASSPEFVERPWLLNDDWRTNAIRSGSRAAMWGAWIFAIFWNAISSIVPFMLYEEVIQDGNYIALVALLFPLVGIGLLAWAIRRTFEWRRFGPAPVTLDPFPGSIGGHVGGRIDVNLPYDPQTEFRVTLTSINSYMSGSGDDRSRKEKARWQDAIVAHAERGDKGTRLTFRFDVPEGLAASDAEQDDDYNLWRLNVAADLPGTDLDRDYEIPVYATARESRFLKDYAIERARAAQTSLDTRAVRELINLSHEVTGKRLMYPMGRVLAGPLGGFLVGTTFAGVGWYLVTKEGQTLFGSIFGGIGALVGLAFFYMLFNSLEVRQTPSGLKTVRRLLGIPIRTTELQRSNIVNLEKKSTMQSQSGGKHTVYYKVYAVDRSGKKHVIGDSFKGASQANAAIALIASEFGINVEEPEPAWTDDEDPLGPDLAEETKSL
jgi:hypothetical protein